MALREKEPPKQPNKTPKTPEKTPITFKFVIIGGGGHSSPTPFGPLCFYSNKVFFVSEFLSTISESRNHEKDSSQNNGRVPNGTNTSSSSGGRSSDNKDESGRRKEDPTESGANSTEYTPEQAEAVKR